MTIGIIGAGPMGTALTARLVHSGENVVVFDRDSDKAEVAATYSELATAGDDEEAAQQDVVILALWHDVAREFAAAHREAMSGRIVVDISNPFGGTTSHPATEPTLSAAEMLTGIVPGSRVLKAFNTTHPPVLHAGVVGGMVPDVFVAGDDDAAKSNLMDIIDLAGLHAVDAGALEAARTLERMTALSIHLSERYGTGFESGFKYLASNLGARHRG